MSIPAMGVGKVPAEGFPSYKSVGESDGVVAAVYSQSEEIRL